MLPHVISVENMRQSDAQAIANHTPSKELMRRAAQGIFDAVQFTGKIAIVCGSGNNGGDGYALACILLDHGMTPTLFRVSDKFSDDGLYYYQTARSFGAEEGNIFAPSPLVGFDIVVDCLLGTGFQGTPRDSFAHAIGEINASGAFVVSADINSGLNGDTGVAELAVHSDVTVSIGCYKTGMFLGDAPDYIDLLVNADIGILPVRDEYKLIDWERLPLFEGYGSLTLSMKEFLEKTGDTPDTLNAGEYILELSRGEGKTVVVKTAHAAIIGDLNYVYFAADYVR